MTELQLGAGEVLSPVQADASIVRQQVEELLDSIRDHQIKLGSSYVQLGAALVQISSQKYWLDWGYRSWGSYIDFVCGQVGRERATIYNVLAVTQKLLPTLGEKTLTDIGISKALELNFFSKRSGLRVPDRLLALALDPKVIAKQLHAEILIELHEHGEVEGKWYSMPGFYVLPDERKEIEEGFRIAQLVDPPPSDSPEHVRNKDAVMKWVREFVGTYAAEANEL